MAIQGLIDTGHVGLPNDADHPASDERPMNWRQGILQRFPNGHAPLLALTAVMKKKTVDDPQFHWWEREVSDVRLILGENIVDEATSAWTITVGPFGGAFQVKKGDILRVEETEELVQVNTDPTVDTVIGVDRGFAGSGTALTVTQGVDVNPNLLIVGSAYPEGADTPRNIRYRPTKFFNLTQIFRDSLMATRTAMQTRLRTVDEVRDAKTECLLYHSIRMEYAMLFGQRSEGIDSTLGTPVRTTQGLINRIDTGTNGDNVVDEESAGALKMERFEELMLEAFRFGSNEKMAFCGNRAMLAFQQMARRNSSLEITPMQKEFGMDVRRFFTPSGTLVLKTHPLFNQVQSKVVSGDTYYAMDAWCLILDMGNMTYRPLRGSDTQYLPDRQANGVDALTSEYLTECGLELQHAKNQFLIKGLFAGANDDAT
jgi:hypothetical protein